MKLLKKSHSDGTATLPIAQRDSNFHLPCLLCFKNMIHHCFLKTVISKLSSCLPLSTKQLQHVSTKPECWINRLRHPQRNAINGFDTCKTKCTNNQAQLAKDYNQKHLKDTMSGPTQNHANNDALAGKSILYVGGRAALYPEYHRLVASLGGRLLIYRGSLKGNVSRLYTFLENADMIVCPIDCVNHNDFFAVKFYCKVSGKPYTLLDRSNLAALNKGIKKLIQRRLQYNTLSSNVYSQSASFQ